MKLFLCIILFALSLTRYDHSTEYTNDHLVLNYPENWIVRPVENTSKINLILETEKLSIWSPLTPDEDRKSLKLTIHLYVLQKKYITKKDRKGDLEGL